MTAKISDCKNGTWGKVKQVISAEMEMRGTDSFRRCCFPLQLQFLFFQDLCGFKHIKDSQWRLCNDPSMCCVTAMLSEKWWLYVNCTWVDSASVYRVVINSFIKQTKPYRWATSAAKFCRCRAAAWFSSSLFPLIFFLVWRLIFFFISLLSVRLSNEFRFNPLFKHEWGRFIQQNTPCWLKCSLTHFWVSNNHLVTASNVASYMIWAVLFSVGIFTGQPQWPFFYLLGVKSIKMFLEAPSKWLDDCVFALCFLIGQFGLTLVYSVFVYLKYVGVFLFFCFIFCKGGTIKKFNVTTFVAKIIALQNIIAVILKCLSFSLEIIKKEKFLNIYRYVQKTLIIFPLLIPLGKLILCIWPILFIVNLKYTY